jgi:DNA polymerase-3 subunit delta'
LIAPEEKGKAIKVDVVRHLIQDMALTPQFGGYRVVIIDQADALNANSANALLKSLEEPPSGTVIVLVTDRPHQLPATIRSRCRNLVLGPVRRDEAIQWLSGQGLGEAAENLLSTASGAPLGAVSLQGSEVLETRHIRFDEWMGVIAGGRDPLDIAEVWSTQAGEMEMAWIASWLSDAIRLGMTEGQGSIRNQDLIDRLRKLAARTSVTFLITAYDRALAAQEALRGPANRQLVFEELLIFWAEAREPAH